MPIDPEGISEALKDAFNSDRVIYQTLKQIQAEQRVVQTTVTELKEQMIRWEPVVKSVEELQTEIKNLKEERQRRAGMQWLIEWTVKYVPWLTAAAASIWALKS